MGNTRGDIIKALSELGHWDEAAIAIFLSYADEDPDGSLFVRGDALTEARLIGSRLYREMYQASLMSPRDKALLPIRQMQGYVDKNDMLQLKRDVYHFSPALAPHDKFWEEYATNVRDGFPQGLSALDRDAAAMRMVHQFRMYIDRHNIEYIRRKYAKGEPFVGASGGVQSIQTDLDSLMAYNQDLRSAGYPPLYFDEPSRFHNKLFGDEVFERQVNDKIETANRHGEFILNRYTGKFVTQWDVLEVHGDVVSVPSDLDVEDQRTILNSESFNYAPGRLHFRYDVEPARENPLHGLEYDYKQQLKNSELWHNIPLATYRETIKRNSYPAMRALDKKEKPKKRTVAANRVKRSRAVQRVAMAKLSIRRHQRRTLAIMGIATLLTFLWYRRQK